jgi:hypothetical protein
MTKRQTPPAKAVSRWNGALPRNDAKEIAAIKREQPGWRNGAKVVKRG